MWWCERCAATRQDGRCGLSIGTDRTPPPVLEHEPRVRRVESFHRRVHRIAGIEEQRPVAALLESWLHAWNDLAPRPRHYVIDGIKPRKHAERRPCRRRKRNDAGAAALDRIGGVEPLAMARLALVMDGRLPLRRARDEEARIEASRFNFRSDPVREIRELVERQADTFRANDLPEGDLPREEVAPISGEALHGPCRQRARQQHAGFFEQFTERRDM